MARPLMAPAKLQHIYDLHAGDFGLSGRKNAKQLQRLSEAIEAHLSDSATQLISGRYRGQEANLYFNKHSQTIVVTRRDETVIAAFKASPAQAGYIVSSGRLN